MQLKIRFIIMYAFIIPFMCTTCHAHLIVLDFIILIMFGDTSNYATLSSILLFIST
jgi:hypothetical protein